MNEWSDIQEIDLLDSKIINLSFLTPQILPPFNSLFYILLVHLVISI